MRKKLAIIFALAVLLAVALVFRPWQSPPDEPPRFLDRLPDADVIGKANILDLSESLEQTTYYYRVPFREFLTREFILLQAKSFGVDVQKPVYFFANQKEWNLEDLGAMFLVKDSSLVRSGINRMSRFVKLTDTTIYEQTVFQNRALDIYLAYGEDWLMVYNGDHFKRTFHDVLFARKNQIPPKWRAFLNREKFDGTPLVARWASRNLENYGFKAVDVRLKNDSTSFTLNSVIHQQDSLAIGLKDKGPAYSMQEFTKTLANLHLDVSKLSESPNDPVYRIMKQLAAKISFPLRDFLLAWDGDIAFRQGGLQTYREKYISSELDENFNVTEVVKYKTIKLPGYALHLSMNNNYPGFINRLMVKGILTKPDKRYRLLFSPPLALQQNESSVTLHTASYYEKPDIDNKNSVLFTNNKTSYTFYLDSLGTHSYHCRLHIPLHYLVEDNIPSDDL